MKCGKIGCINDGLYQPLIRIKASVLPASGSDVLAMIRMPWTLCTRHRFSATDAEVIGAVPLPKMAKVLEDAKAKTGAAPNPDRTDVHWVRILGKRS